MTQTTLQTLESNLAVAPDGTNLVKQGALAGTIGADSVKVPMAHLVDASLNDVAGASATGVTQPTGGSGLLGWLSGIYQKLSGSLSVTVGNWPATQAVSGSVSVSNQPSTLAVTQPTAANLNATVVGSVTANIGTTNGVMLDSTGQALLNAIKAQINISGSLWFDKSVNPVAYYVRRESVNEGTSAVTVSWFNPDGSTATPVVSNLQAVSNAQNIINESAVYTATAAGTGYALGDVIIHSFGIDTGTTPPVVAYGFWFNANSGTILSTTPTANTYTQVNQPVSVSSLPLPTGAATDVSIQSLLTAVTTLNASINAMNRNVALNNLVWAQAYSLPQIVDTTLTFQ